MKKRKSILTKAESRVLIGLFIAIVLVILFFIIDISTYPGNIYWGDVGNKKTNIIVFRCFVRDNVIQFLRRSIGVQPLPIQTVWNDAERIWNMETVFWSECGVFGVVQLHTNAVLYFLTVLLYQKSKLIFLGVFTLRYNYNYLRHNTRERKI